MDARDAREARAARDERIYQSLPPLGSTAYLSLLNTASAAELPASVLVRAYRQLGEGPAADATLERLLGHDDRYGYLTVVFAAAHRRMARLDAYSPDDLVADTIGEIVATLAGPEGKMAEGAWLRYVNQCMEHAYRKLVGRRGGKLKPQIDAVAEQRRSGYDPIETADVASIPWHGRVAPDNLEWLERFIESTFAAIPRERVRAVALDMFSHSPTPVSSGDPDDPNTLAGQFGVTRSTIHTWKRHALTLLRSELESQNEREIDLSFLTFTG